MHQMTRDAAEVGGYYIDDFTLENRYLVNETRRLTLEQVTDDVHSTANTRGRQMDRIGREWVGHADDDPGDGYITEHAETLWRRWTPDQVAREAGMAVFLNRLTDKQREAIRLTFNAGLTERVAAAYLGITRDSLRDRESNAIKSLRRMLLEAFVNQEPEVAA